MLSTDPCLTSLRFISAFGYVDLSDDKSRAIVEKFAVNRDGPTLLVFKDNSGRPSVVLGVKSAYFENKSFHFTDAHLFSKASEMPKGALNDILSANKFVSAPRLTSQHVFDELCPAPKGSVHDIR